MFRIESLFPVQLMEIAKKLCKYDWYRLGRKKEDDEYDIAFRRDMMIEAGLPPKMVTEVSDKLNLVGWINLTNFLKLGPKLVEVSYENCIALENIKINLPFDDYRQPYPSIAIELPEKYRQRIFKLHGLKTPRVILSHHEVDYAIFMSLLYNDKMHGDVAVCLNKSKKYPTLEEQLDEKIGENKYDQYRIYTTSLERLVLNLNLVLTHYGVESKGIHRFPGKKHAKDIGIEILEPPQQHIKFYERKEYAGTGESTHRSPDPHWRNGHHKSQPYGPQNSLRKRIFVKPVFVCGWKYKGDIGDTSATYEV